MRLVEKTAEVIECPVARMYGIVIRDVVPVVAQG
jgi:hypothetical protein